MEPPALSMEIIVKIGYWDVSMQCIDREEEEPLSIMISSSQQVTDRKSVV